MFFSVIIEWHIILINYRGLHTKKRLKYAIEIEFLHARTHARTYTKNTDNGTPKQCHIAYDNYIQWLRRGFQFS